MTTHNHRDAPQHIQRAIALFQQGKLVEAEGLCNKVLLHSPSHFVALHLLGVIACQSGQTRRGLELISKALDISPTAAEAHHDRGLALQELGRLDEAIASYDQATQLKPNYAEAYRNRAFALLRRGKFEEALASYERAFALAPNLPFLCGARLHAKFFVCGWQHWEEDIVRLEQMLENGERAAAPLPVLALPVSRRHQLSAARTWTSVRHPPSNALPGLSKRAKPDKLRIGYFSSDFTQHALAWWIAELIEKHDRSRFEIVGFSLKDANDQMRRRLRAGFDRFIDVQSQSDSDVALLARSLDIDIAVDLNGFTAGGRTNIFALRAAPIQVNYLGYAGTMGADYVDYLVADPTLIPAEHRQDYAEKIVYLPDTYQPNDTSRPISERAFTRAELGLPQDGFVFCCFNNTYKITPEVFDDWMAILARVPGSVLWLLETSVLAMSNLRHEAGQRGIAAERLVFAKRMALPEYLARNRLADLFLDTLPYNACTTASDALWTGLPVLTRLGDAFVGRVAASLLKAIGLPELITTSRQAYREQAVELATNPGKLRELKLKLAANRLTTPLFDTKRYVRHLEAAYEAMYARYEAGLPPDHIHVQPADRLPDGPASDQSR
jgi:predicted O-linked N-acetylglucosamine transferase (SPINDLY family)